MIHPLVNSGGARYLPSLVAEDVLVEDFPDPAEGQTPPASELVKSLRLSGRRGLPRIVIEQALLMHGARILENELGLDPRVFRLVCIPPDVYVRLGEAEGWGRQPFWTHFDGYLIRTVRGPGTATGARRRRRPLRRTLRAARGRPRLRLRPSARTVRRRAARAHGRMVTSAGRLHFRNGPI